METEGSAVAVGIDAAVVADHHVVVRRPVAGGPGEVLEAFSVPPTLGGMGRLAKRLAPYTARLRRPPRERPGEEGRVR